MHYCDVLKAGTGYVTYQEVEEALHRTPEEVEVLEVRLHLMEVNFQLKYNHNCDIQPAEDGPAPPPSSSSNLISKAPDPESTKEPFVAPLSPTITVRILSVTIVHASKSSSSESS